MPSWIRSEIELLQPYKRHKGFTHTNTTDVAEEIASISGTMQEGNKVSLIVELYDAYVEFDGDATSSSMLVLADTGYYDSNIQITSNISMINKTAGQNARIRGIVWGR